MLIVIVRVSGQDPTRTRACEHISSRSKQAFGAEPFLCLNVGAPAEVNPTVIGQCQTHIGVETALREALYIKGCKIGYDSGGCEQHL